MFKCTVNRTFDRTNPDYGNTRCDAFFEGAQDLILVQLTLLVQKIIKKTLAGPFIGKPPKLYCNAPQCTAM